jgi:hypothetical protein
VEVQWACCRLVLVTVALDLAPSLEQLAFPGCLKIALCCSALGGTDVALPPTSLMTGLTFLALGESSVAKQSGM